MLDAKAADKAKSLSLDRQRIYNFMSRVYREESDNELLQTLIKADFSQMTTLEDEELKEGCRILKLFLQEARSKDVTEDLAVEFATIFLGHGAKPAHPYASVYLGQEKVVMQEPRNEAVRTYAKVGLQRSEYFNEPEDHIAIEMEFMAHLCRKAADLITEGDIKTALSYLELQQVFLNNHICRWVPEFCNDILNAAELDYYKAIAKITRGFLNIDPENIKYSMAALKS